SEWRETPLDAIPPIQADWVEAPDEVRHTFTHFHLRLRVMVAQVDAPQTNQTFTAAENFRPADLPTVMRKIWSMAEAET
ncbi:NUDIX domain-containing protein, partial [Planktomarina temperata]|nr:NUDIX domain-containing protein [Planktomarina temperata]